MIVLGDNVRSFWLFRTNLKQFEYYHKYKSANDFKTYCHDFYLLQGIWLLENDIFDEVVIWRLCSYGTKCEDIVFNVNNKLFVQKFVDNFEECFKHNPRPKVTFFRGGFPEYGKLTKAKPERFGLALYCGTGRRVYPKHSGIYNKILVEDDKDLTAGCVKFYKTASTKRFRPIKQDKLYDICWPCNFTQASYKGQEFFIKQISRSGYLQGLKILHVGNKPEIGAQLCKKYNISNVVFAGYTSRRKLNLLLNQSKLALITSNRTDGSPRLITEIMCAGTPLLLRKDTRALKYFREKAIGFGDYNVEQKIKEAVNNYPALKEKAVQHINDISMDVVCNKNIKHWI